MSKTRFFPSMYPASFSPSRRPFIAPSRIMLRTLLMETNGCILLIASYYLLRNLCHIGALEDVFPRCFHLSGNEKSNTGQSDRSNRMIWGFLLARAVFPGHSMTGQQTEIELILPERFSFVHCKKHSDIFRTRQKNPKRTSAVSPEHYTPNKVFPPIFPLGLCR